MKMIFKMLTVCLLVMFCSGFVVAEETDYSFIDCMRDEGITKDSSKIDIAKAARVCKDYIDTEEIKLTLEEIKAKIEEAELQEKMELFQACLEENGVVEIADLRELEDPRAVLGDCLLEAGIDMDQIKEDLKDKISEALAEKAEEIKACIADIDMDAMTREEALEAVKACFSDSE